MLVHGTVMHINDWGVLLRGPSGSGKSDLALRLMARGACLVADDQVRIEEEQGALTAFCPQALEGQLEVRGVGIVDVPFHRSCALSCVIDLVPATEVQRMPDPLVETLLGVSIPRFQLHAFHASTVDKIIYLTQ